MTLSLALWFHFFTASVLLFSLGAIAVAYSQVHGQFLGTNESTVSISLSLSELSVQLPEQQAVPCPLFCSQ
jgi:hypothetical protein